MTEQQKPEDATEQDATPQAGAPKSGEAEKPPAAEGAEAAPQAAEQPKAAAAPEKKATPKAKQAEKPAPRPGAGASPAGPETAVVTPLPEPGQPAVSRRNILRVGFWSSLGVMAAGMGACGVDLLYPRGVTGFGGTVSVDPKEVPAPGQKASIQRGRFWLAHLTEEQGGPGILALWWKCPHLGCTVPWKENFIWPDAETGAPTQGWFRCPCHGSTYTDAGVRVFGPAPRSLDTMALSVRPDGGLTVDTGSITNGSPDNAERAVRL